MTVEKKSVARVKLCNWDNLDVIENALNGLQEPNLIKSQLMILKEVTHGV